MEELIADINSKRGIYPTPYLDGSEDERIREKIVNLLERAYKFGDASIDGNDYNEIFAWLKKKKIPEGSPTPDLTTMLVPNRYNEQKPAEWSEEDKKKLNRIYEILGHAADDKGFLTSKRIIGDKEAVELQDWLKDLPNRISLQPKQEWSAEDKGVIEEAAALALGWVYPTVCIKLNSILSRVKSAEWSEDIIRKAIKEVGLTQHQIDWFKTNVFPPKQEWSEEDSRMIETIIDHLERHKHYLMNTLNIESCQEWLKSLRNRYLWKPSEEQMAYLAKAILYCIPEGDDKTVSVMKELHKELNQL